MDYRRDDENRDEFIAEVAVEELFTKDEADRLIAFLHANRDDYKALSARRDREWNEYYRANPGRDQ